MSMRILGIATAHPKHAMSQLEAIQLATELCDLDDRQAKALATLYRRSGVRNRYTVVPHREAFSLAEPEEANDGFPTATAVRRGPRTAQRMGLYQQHASRLAHEACGRALETSRCRAHDITHLVTVSCTGFAAPGVDIELIRRLELSPTVERISVGFMGCHGAINGLRTAQAIATSDPTARVLLCAVECCSLHYRFDPEEVTCVANAVFADGAAALVCRGDEGAVSEDVTRAPNAAARAGLRLVGTGSCLLPETIEEMTWSIGDYGFEMELSPRVPGLIEQGVRPWLADWLKRHGASIEGVRHWAVHPGGPRILAAVQVALGLSRDDLANSYDVLDRFGNMSSPTVLFLLERAMQAERGPTVALAFGPGLVAEVALLM